MGAPSAACRATRSNTLRCALCNESISIGGMTKKAAGGADADDDDEDEKDDEDEEVANR